MKPIAFLPSSFINAFASLTQSKTASVTKTVREGWTKAQKDALVRRISGSLGVKAHRIAKL